MYEIRKYWSQTEEVSKLIFLTKESAEFKVIKFGSH